MSEVWKELMDRVRVETSDGRTCFVCDTEIEKDEDAVTVSVRIKLLVASKWEKNWAHIRCASLAGQAMAFRVRQARAAGPKKP